MNAPEIPTSDSPLPPGVSTDSSLLVQSCPACEAEIDVSNQEPLSNTACPDCGENVVVGDWIDNYQLLSVAGRGGMGVVYRAMDTGLHRKVALKVLRKDRLSKQSVAQLETEAAITASINHPHVVKVFTTGTDHGRFYIAMELVTQGTLDDLIRVQGCVAEAQVLELGIQVAQGLRAAAQMGMIHRDVKPGNILFSDAHTAKVVDFGLAMLEEAAAEAAGAEIWGTPYYVAPEKLDRQPEDFRSDIYSLGATLFHALAGRPPFEAEDASMVALKHLKSQAVSLQAFAPRVSGSTAYVINRTLLKNPDERYQSYNELIEHLEYARNELLQNGGKPQGKKRLVLESEEHQKVWSYLTFGMIAICILLVGGFFLFTKKSSSPEKAKASVVASGDQRPAAFEGARQQMIDGKTDQAARAFHALAEDGATPAPWRQWSFIHEALSQFLAGNQADAAIALISLGHEPYIADGADARLLATFFTGISAAGASSQSATPTTAKKLETGEFSAIAPLLLGLKDWDAGQFDDAGTLLRSFESLTPIGEYSWIAEYKPLAAEYLADYTDYRGAVTLSKEAKTAGEIAKAKAALLRVKSELRKGKSLSKRIDEAIAEIEKTAAATKDAAIPKTAEISVAPQNDHPTKAINELRDTLASLSADWRFAEARDRILKAQATDDISRLEKGSLTRKLEWLVDFKSTLVSDATRNRSKVTFRRADGSEIKGDINTYSEGGITLGSGETIPWAKLSPDSVMELAKTLIHSDSKPVEIARRSWIAGVYGLFSRRLAEARVLLDDGRKARIQYDEALPMLLPSKPVNFARGADASASNASDDAGKGAEQAIDGTTTSKWHTDQPGPQWLSLDLHKAATINRWVVKHAQSDGGIADFNTPDFELQKSEDAQTWTSVDRVSNNTAAVTNRDVQPFSARYLRLLVTRPARNSNPDTRICELELYGPSSKEAPDFFAPVQSAVLPHFTATNLGLPQDASYGYSQSDEATGRMSIHAGGADIWGIKDEGRFLSREVNGNATLVAFIESIERADPFTKSGIMFRENSSPDARNVYLSLTPENGVLFQIRKEPGVTGFSVKEKAFSGSCWLRIVRTGDSYTASASQDGIGWKQIGNPETVVLGAKPLAGIACTAHVAKKVALSTVSEVKITSDMLP